MFTEANTVERMILAAVTQLGGTPASLVREDAPSYGGKSLGDELCPARRTYAPPHRRWFARQYDHVRAQDTQEPADPGVLEPPS